jgi:hypothetical protein
MGSLGGSSYHPVDQYGNPATEIGWRPSPKVSKPRGGLVAPTYKVPAPAPTGGGGAPRPYKGGGAVAPPPANFSTESTPYMKEVMQMYRDLINQNRELAGKYDVEDLANKQRAEGSIALREAEAAAGRTGGMSSAERRNILSDQYRKMGEVRGAGERSKLEFERGLLSDLTGAIGGATGLAGTEGDFLNRARQNEIDVWRAGNQYGLDRDRLALDYRLGDIGLMTSLAGLV